MTERKSGTSREPRSDTTLSEDDSWLDEYPTTVLEAVLKILRAQQQTQL